MKIKSGYKLREIGDTAIVVAVGKESLKFNGMISVNSTGAFIWKMLSDGATEQMIVTEILKKYETDEVSASISVKDFIEQLRKAELLDE